MDRSDADAIAELVAVILARIIEAGTYVFGGLVFVYFSALIVKYVFGF